MEEHTSGDAFSDTSSVSSEASSLESDALSRETLEIEEGAGISLLPIFPDRSVNLVTSASNSGKTHLLLHMLKHRDVFFGPDSVRSILYVNCNLQSSHSEPENPFSEIEDDLPPLTVVNLADISNVRDISSPKQVVILDDVVFVNEIITQYITYSANHMDLIVFVVTQGCLSEKLFKLVYKVHNIILLLKNSSGVNLGQFLLGRFFLSKEKKDYLRHVLSKAEAGKHSVVLKLNAVSSSPVIYKKIFAFGNVEQLFADENRYCIVYPELGELDQFKEMDIPSNLDPETFVLVQAKRVKREDQGETAKMKCSKADKWKEMNDEISSEIRSSFDMKKWKDAFIIFKEILKVEEFCISHDYRTLFIKSKKNIRVSLIDFLTVVTRRSYPSESLEKLSPYVPFVKILIKNNIPSTFIKNQMLTQLATDPAKLRKSRNGPKVKKAGGRMFF